MAPAPLRIVYMGTPDFAVPALARLIQSENEVVGVVTQPDRPSGRGKKLTPPPVKRMAEAAGIEVYQPTSVRTNEALERISRWEPDVIVVAAYGKILPARLLELPPHGCINIHASLLPKYRGAAPINWAIVNGEKETGVTIMQMDEGLDTGPMLLKGKVSIGPLDTAQEIHDRLAFLGADLVVDAMMRLRLDSLESFPQDDEKATYAPMLSKEQGLIDWTRPAAEVANHIRGFNPWPGAYSFHVRNGSRERVKFHLAEPVAGQGAPGDVIEVTTHRLVIACGEDAIACLNLQAPGRKAMEVTDFLNGYDIAPGDKFSSHG